MCWPSLAHWGTLHSTLWPVLGLFSMLLHKCLHTFGLKIQVVTSPREGYRAVEVDLEEDRDVAQRAGAPLLQRWAQGAGLLQYRLKKALGRPHCSLPVLKIRRGTNILCGLMVIGQGGLA